MRAEFVEWIRAEGCRGWTREQRVAARDAWNHQQARADMLEAELGVAREQLKGAQSAAVEGERQKRAAACEAVLDLPDRVAALTDVTCGKAQAVHVDVRAICSEIYEKWHPNMEEAEPT